jgi:hypothetical protein
LRINAKGTEGMANGRDVARMGTGRSGLPEATVLIFQASAVE